MILSICDNADVLSVFRIIIIIITMIKIAVPIILILSLMINYLSAVRSDDYDALAKANKQSASKIVAAALVFFIPTFVHVISDIASYDRSNYTNCIANANSGYISDLIVSNAKVYLGYAKKSLKRPDYILAENMIKKVKDDAIREELNTELKEVEKEIKAKEQKEEQERESHQQDVTSPGGSNPGGTSSGYSPGVSGKIDNVMGVYYYKQCDSRWGKIQYDKGGATLCSSACGYTSFAMIAAGLNNDTSIDPYTVIKYMRNISDGGMTNRGYGAASWSEIAGNSVISKYNLSATKINKSDILKNLKNGKPVIALVPGHYVVLSYSSRGNVVLLDPYVNWADSRKKSGEFEAVSDIEHIYGNISTAYAYSKK